MIKQGFLSNPILELVDRPKHTPRKAVLKEPFVYIDQFGKSWMVPTGTEVNGTSYPIWRPKHKFFDNVKRIPAIVAGKMFSWYPWVGFERNASIIHDYLCDTKIVDSLTAHYLYKEMVFWLLDQAYEGERNSLEYEKARLKAKIITWAVIEGGPKF